MGLNFSLKSSVMAFQTFQNDVQVCYRDRHTGVWHLYQLPVQYVIAVRGIPAGYKCFYPRFVIEWVFKSVRRSFRQGFLCAASFPLYGFAL
jgi:hypothetical protein